MELWEQLAQALLDDDRATFVALLRESDYLRRRATKLVAGLPLDAEEVADTALVDVWSKLGRVREKYAERDEAATPERWLKRVLLNALLDAMRRLRPRAGGTAADSRDDEGAPEPVVAEDRRPPEAPLVEDEDEARFYASIEAMPHTKYRIMIKLDVAASGREVKYTPSELAWAPPREQHPDSRPLATVLAEAEQRRREAGDSEAGAGVYSSAFLAHAFGIRNESHDVIDQWKKNARKQFLKVNPQYRQRVMKAEKKAAPTKPAAAEANHPGNGGDGGGGEDGGDGDVRHDVHFAPADAKESKAGTPGTAGTARTAGRTGRRSAR